MKGRLEHSLIHETRAKKLLEGRESYFTEYYYSLSVSKQPTTIYRYVKCAINFIDFIKDRKPDFSITELKKMDVDMYMDHIKYSNKNGELKTTGDRRMATVWSLIRSFVTFLVGAEYLEKDIMAHSERPKIRNNAQRVFMEQSEIRTVLKAAEDDYESEKCHYHYEGWGARNLLIIRILMETGMRVTALTEINIEDIDFDNNNVKVVDKRGKIHTHPLTKETMTLAKEWIDVKTKNETKHGHEPQDALLVAQQTYRRLSAESVNKVIKKYTEGFDKKITAHKFRGTYGTNLYRATGDIYLVKECMGHTNVATTQIYVEPKADTKEKALEIMSKIMNS